MHKDFWFPHYYISVQFRIIANPDGVDLDQDPTLEKKSTVRTRPYIVNLNYSFN